MAMLPVEADGVTRLATVQMPLKDGQTFQRPVYMELVIQDR